MNRRQFLTFGQTMMTSNAPTALFRGRLKNQRNANLTPQQAAARFLMQATFGPTMAEIDNVTTIGFEAWLAQQFTAPRTETLKYMQEVINQSYHFEGEPLEGPETFRWAWWQAVMRNPDMLRQRIAMALSEILVISTRPDELYDINTAIASYYDMLLKHAFGNFRDLLFDMALHPAMGFYLSHAGNRKADLAANRFPDENFAREIMQLFAIGLFELNQDGTRKKDLNGKDIPTYDNDDIKEFAKIFTGLTYADAERYEEEDIVAGSNDAFELAELTFLTGTRPMKMYDQFHEPGEKRLLNGYVIPAGQTGLQDVNDAIDHLFSHPNVGPFIGRLLIQRLVKSHPSAAYVGRVAAAFANNGRGVRGDMQAVIQAILLDDEARNTSYITDPTHGMLREPFIRYTQLCRAMELQNENGENLFYNFAYYAEENIGQYPFNSPSVFNFFSPDYKPLGALLNAGISAPEFQIMTSVTAIKLVNFMDIIIREEAMMELPEDEEEEEGLVAPSISPAVMNLAPYYALDGDVPALIERLNLLFAYGSLSSAMLNIIQSAVTNLYNETDDWDEAIRLALILVVNCPEYAILK